METELGGEYGQGDEGRRVKPDISVTWGTRVDEVLAL